MQQKGRILLKSDLDGFLSILSGYGDIFAPIKRDVASFEKIKNADEICFDEHAWFPPKQFLFPERNVMFRFEGEKVSVDYNEIKPTVLFGLRSCDLNGFRVNDKLFVECEYTDPLYKKRRDSLLLVGLYCYNEMDEYCFCDSMELEDYYDIMLIDRGNYYHVKAGSKKGEKFVEKLDKKEDFIPPKTTCKKSLKTKDISSFYKHGDWKKGADMCISCGHCTNLCPTCLCFTIEDDVNMDGSGERTAKLDSCQFKDFTKVTGDHVFRESRLDRFKHRIYHKIDYFKKQFDIYMCTGCGRCIRGCPEKIDWIDIANGLK